MVVLRVRTFQTHMCHEGGTFVTEVSDLTGEIPQGSLAHVTSSLAFHLSPISDLFTSALPFSRDRHCQHLVQASVSLAQISNKEKTTGI